MRVGLLRFINRSGWDAVAVVVGEVVGEGLWNVWIWECLFF